MYELEVRKHHIFQGFMSSLLRECVSDSRMSDVVNYDTVLPRGIGCFPPKKCTPLSID